MLVQYEVPVPKLIDLGHYSGIRAGVLASVRVFITDTFLTEFRKAKFEGLLVILLDQI